MSRQRWASTRDFEQQMGSGATCPPCGGKARFLTKKAAKTTIRRMKGRQGRLNAYRCPEDLRFWHIGHVPTGLREGRVARQELRPRGQERAS